MADLRCGEQSATAPVLLNACQHLQVLDDKYLVCKGCWASNLLPGSAGLVCTICVSLVGFKDKLQLSSMTSSGTNLPKIVLGYFN